MRLCTVIKIVQRSYYKGKKVMITRIKSNKIISENNLISGYVYFEDGIITEVSGKELPFDKEYDMTDFYVSPGFIDIHTHGGKGFDFINSENDVIEGCNFHLKHGTTSICPTISAAPIEKMEKALEYISRAKKSENLKSNIIGAHMEGPYLSKEQCGAQCPDFITPPVREDYERIISTYKDVIARWTYAPENDKNGEFCKALTDNGIVASAGHTNAEYSHMKTAAENGCSLITHLYSCTSTVTRKQGFRYLGVIESAYLMDDLYVEIIADGKHLPPELISLILKIKGTDKVALITDSLSLAGTDEKHGFMLDTEYIIEDGVCKLKDRSAFAGSIATADVLIKTLVNEVKIPIPEAVSMLTEVPAKIMNVRKGKLERGYDSDIIVFDDEINIRKVFLDGKEF